MPEIIPVADLTFKADQELALAFKENNFLDFRLNPKFRDEANFRPKLKSEMRTLSHYFQVPAGYEIKDMPKILDDRMLREPIDIREVIAIGKTITEKKVDLFIFAPQITGSPNLLMRITRYPDWQGFGLTTSKFDPDDENLWDLDFVGFSTP